MKYNAAALYAQAAAQIHMDEAAAERVRRALEQKQMQHSANARRPKGQRLWTAAIAAALTVLVLIGAALAAESAGIIPDILRRGMGISDAAAPMSVSYETVTEAENARWTDVKLQGVGELYASAYTVIRGEAYQVVTIGVNTVTRQQYEDYVWLVQETESGAWYRAEPTSYTPSDCPPWRSGMVLQVTLPAPPVGSSWKMAVCGGYESEDGRAFEICRRGIFSLDTVAYASGVRAEIDKAIPFTNEYTGETGYVTGLEVYPGYIAARCHVEGIYAMEQDMLTGGLPEMEKMLAWGNSLRPWESFVFTFSDGTSESLYSSTENALPGDEWLILWEDDRIAPEDLVSVTVLGETYEMIPMDE